MICELSAHLSENREKTNRTNGGIPMKKVLAPAYDISAAGDRYAEHLDTEYRQCVEEGLNVAAYQNLFDAVHKMERGAEKDEMAAILFRLICQAETVPDYPYKEPSDLEGIRALCRPYPMAAKLPENAELRKKIHGAWLGRICGCLLGKPVEGMRTDELIPFLKETDNCPMRRYLTSPDVADEIAGKYRFSIQKHCLADVISRAPADDDTNYTVMAQQMIERYGLDFTPDDVAEMWLRSQPKTAYFTAEAAAYRNFLLGYRPPQSALYQNPWREWIGAQIRGDYYGYINPGDPEKAAEMAWRDASISHVKNGIYGEIYVAAMLACAAVTNDVRDVIEGGLARIPATSRLYEKIRQLLNRFDDGEPQEVCFARIQSEYDDHDPHHWCHTISNALIVTAALLYGGGDYGKSICLAVRTGFDTDCNGATVGSVVGMMQGESGIGEKWRAPIHGELQTQIIGLDTVRIDEVVEKTMEHIALSHIE